MIQTLSLYIRSENITLTIGSITEFLSFHPCVEIIAEDDSEDLLVGFRYLTKYGSGVLRIPLMRIICKTCHWGPCEEHRVLSTTSKDFVLQSLHLTEPLLIDLWKSYEGRIFLSQLFKDRRGV